MRDTIEELLDEARLLWHRMVEVGEAVHAGEPVTVSMRGVLEALLRRGPRTVPALARERLVARQHIQVLVNALAEGGFVALAENPAHRRSPLVTLTAEGEQLIRRMKRREARLLERAALRLGNCDLAAAARTLRLVRDALKGGE